MKQLPNVIEAGMLMASSGFVVWMIKRACSVITLGYNSNGNKFGVFFKLAFILSLVIPLSQIGIAVVKVIDDDAKDMPFILFNGYTLLAEYVTIDIAGWIASCVILIYKNRTLDSIREWSLIIFWGYFSILHITSGVLRIIFEDYDDLVDSFEIALHFFSGISCFCLSLVSFCNWTGVSEDDLAKRMMVGESFSSSVHSLVVPVKINVKKYKVIGSDIVCTIVVTMDGKQTELKRTYKEFSLFDIKVTSCEIIVGESV